MIFTHDYYFPPCKLDASATVLCMRCASRIKATGITAEEVKARYKEKKIKWVMENGIKGDGVLILCPGCVDLPIPEENFPLIHRQIMKALEDEAKWAKLPLKTDLKNMTIMNQEAA